MTTLPAPDPALWALSPLDGRYAAITRSLSAYFSEFALIRYRVMIEVEYLIALLGEVERDWEAFPADAFADLQAIYARFGPEDAAIVKAHEQRIHHDVKAVEYFLKERLRELPALAPHLEKIHLGLTSEDVNNLAYACMVREACREELLPALVEAFQVLRDLVARTRQDPMLARTHGQPASPTTMGKELAVFLHRLAPELEGLHRHQLTGKLSGATGTYGAMQAAYPQVDWPAFASRFISNLGLVPNLITTQIEPRDCLASLCDRLRRLDHILLDLSQDMWRYISDGYFRQERVAEEVGSSAMPHKINPISFENAEGNLGLADALFAFFGDKLTISRLQRDLSDSTVMRNLGVALGHALIAYRSLTKGLRRLELDRAVLGRELEAHPEVLAEPYQTILRAAGHPAPYEQLKELTRGSAVTLAQLRTFAAGLALEPETRERLLALTPARYTGYAVELADSALAEADALLLHLKRG